MFGLQDVCQSQLMMQVHALAPHRGTVRVPLVSLRSSLHIDSPFQNLPQLGSQGRSPLL